MECFTHALQLHPFLLRPVHPLEKLSVPNTMGWQPWDLQQQFKERPEPRPLCLYPWCQCWFQVAECVLQRCKPYVTCNVFPKCHVASRRSGWRIVSESFQDTGCPSDTACGVPKKMCAALSVDEGGVPTTACCRGGGFHSVQ